MIPILKIFSGEDSLFLEQRRAFFGFMENFSPDKWREERYQESTETPKDGQGQESAVDEEKRKWNGWGDYMAREGKSMPSEFSVPQDIKLYMLELKENATRYGSDGTSVFTTGTFYKAAKDGSRYKITIPFQTTIMTEGWAGWTVEKISAGGEANVATRSASAEGTGTATQSVAAEDGAGTTTTRGGSVGENADADAGADDARGDAGAGDGSGTTKRGKEGTTEDGEETETTVEDAGADEKATRAPETVKTSVHLTPLSQTPKEGNVTLNFDGTDIKEVSKIIIEDLLAKNHAKPDDPISGTGSIETSKQLPREDHLIPALQILLAQNGLKLAVRGTGSQEEYKILPKENTEEGYEEIESPTFLDAINLAKSLPGKKVQALQPRKVEATAVAKLINAVLPEGSSAVEGGDANFLFFFTDSLEIEKMQTFIDWIDGQKGKDVSVEEARKKFAEFQK